MSLSGTDLENYLTTYYSDKLSLYSDAEVSPMSKEAFILREKEIIRKLIQFVDNYTNVTVDPDTGIGSAPDALS